jgi:hypothetical protein
MASLTVRYYQERWRSSLTAKGGQTAKGGWFFVKEYSHFEFAQVAVFPLYTHRIVAKFTIDLTGDTNETQSDRSAAAGVVCCERGA